LKRTGAFGTTTIGIKFQQDVANAQLILSTGTLKFAQSAVQAAGKTILNGGSLETTSGYELTGGDLFGVGTIVGDLTTFNGDARVHPGMAGQPGTINVTGTYTHGTNATLVIDISSTGSYGVLNVQGTITLNGGKLSVIRNENYKPGLYTPPLDILVSGAGGIGDAFGDVTITNNSWTTMGGICHFAHGFDTAHSKYQLTVSE
jgi:hypothetical protein